MMSYYLHYKNKYPGGRVSLSESALDVYDAEGEHCVALRKDGGGSFIDRSAAMGCKHEHDLAPIPKDARLFKLKDGKVSKDELYDERSKGLERFLQDGKILSCDDLKEKFQFDEKQRLLK